MTITIQKLESEITAKQKELDDLKAALRVLKRLEGIDAEERNFDKPKESVLPLTESGEIDFDMLELPEKSSSVKSTTQDLTKDVINKFGGKEFTVNHVYAALLQLGKVEESKHVKNRISMAVRKLADEGFVVLTHKGAGNDPHKYKIAQKQVSFLSKYKDEQK